MKRLTGLGILSSLRWRLVSGLALCVVAAMGANCRKAAQEPMAGENPTPPATTLPQPEPETAPAVKPAIEWEKVETELEAIDDPDRWLTVTKGDPKEEGAWATGRFDAGRNRLEITTRDALEFTVDVGRIEIDWSKLVILRINDRNTELKKREQSVYRFVRGSQGQWEVRQ